MKKLLSFCLVLAFISSINSMQTQGLLIFLDDSEKSMGAITGDFLSAFMQEAGPIIVSRSIIANILVTQKPQETDVHKLFEQISEITKKSHDKRTPDEKRLEKEILLSSFDFKERLKNWSIKQINDKLYLLFLHRNLDSAHISIEDFAKVVSTKELTPIELLLGLKVNHMKTVSVDSIPVQYTDMKYASYFVESLNDIFITNAEYPENKKELIPAWSIFINGHGTQLFSVAYLSIDEFQIFLNFLEKLKTRLLVYDSCYAGGINAELLYKDSKRSIHKTYSFAIITQALTDAYSYAAGVYPKLENNKIKLDPYANYKFFLAKITNPDVINYASAIAEISSGMPQAAGQIKYPGLPWFSVLNTEKVLPIGSVLAKSRTKPLNVATFFSRKGRRAEPLAIALYADEIPFELIIDTIQYPATIYVPKFISMIPGSGDHFFKKISSTLNTAEDIMNAFEVGGYGPQKVYNINKLQAPFGSELEKILHHREGTLEKVVVEVFQGVTKYFLFQEKLYVVEGSSSEHYKISLANDAQRKAYEELIAEPISSQQQILERSLKKQEIYRIQQAIEKRKNK